MRSALLSDLHVMLGKCNPFPRLFMDCAARMRKDGHENMRWILRADGAEGDSRRYNLPGEPEVACVIADSTAGKPMDIAIAMEGGGFFLYTSLIRTTTLYRTP